jgi:D-sedoheptulose 7-phosphate isomerase
MSLKIIENHIEEHINTVVNIDETQKSEINSISEIMINSLSNGGTIYWCGNGGSSSDSQHLAAELIGRYDQERKPLNSISLTTDSAVLTCIANDYGFDDIFSRQIEGLGKSGDILVGISTSGKSQNVYNALKKAQDMNLITIGFLGKGGGKIQSVCNKNIIINSNITARIQEMHILIGHILCESIEYGLGLLKDSKT